MGQSHIAQMVYDRANIISLVFPSRALLFAEIKLCRKCRFILHRGYATRTDCTTAVLHFPLQQTAIQVTRASCVSSRIKRAHWHALGISQCFRGLALGSVCKWLPTRVSDDMHISNGIQVSFPQVSSEALTPVLAGINLHWRGIRGMQCGPNRPGGRRRPTVAGAMRETKSSLGQI